MEEYTGIRDLKIGILFTLSENKYIRNYTVADIEKYWKGKLSDAEMHAMEKAALEDPFLADALEGYKNITNAPDDIQQLRQKLEERISGKTKVLSLGSSKTRWLRAAAAIIIIGGLGVLTQQLFFKPGKNEMALSKENKSLTSDSIQASIPGQVDTTEVVSTSAENKNEKMKPREKTINPDAVIQPAKSDKLSEKGPVYSGKTLPSPKENKEPPVAEGEALTKPSAVAEAVAAPSAKSKSETDKQNEGMALEEVVVAQKKQNALQAGRNAGSMTTLKHRYNYRVVDAQNNPIPFANVSNTNDGVGTYTDMNGYFNLVSGDSMMEVKVKSLGYTTSAFTLLPSEAQPEIVMQEDEKLRASVLANSRKVVSSVARKDTAELEEPEVGWGYYNTYAANNLKIPDNIPDKKPVNHVELSFELDKYGQPVNIKVIKSSECKACDKEAVRLLKEGPKWKRKGRKTKTSVIVAFDK